MWLIMKLNPCLCEFFMITALYRGSNQTHFLLLHHHHHFLYYPHTHTLTHTHTHTHTHTPAHTDTHTHTQPHTHTPTHTHTHIHSISMILIWPQSHYIMTFSEAVFSYGKQRERERGRERM